MFRLSNNRKYLRELLFSAMLITAVGFNVAVAKNFENDKVNKQAIATKLDPYFKALADNKRLLGTVALYQEGQEIYRTTLVSKQDKTRLSDETYKYKVGSITKTFTATLVWQLIEEGELSLDTKLAAFYPKVANAKQITIGQMLNHHSGIHNYTDEPDFMTYYSSPQDHSFLINKIEGFEAYFEPGEKAAYNNNNYLLLGYILEQVSGKSYAELLNDRIYKPLGMKSSLLGKAVNPDNGEAYSYRLQDEKWQQVPEWDMSVAYSAGAVVSTTEDLDKFIRGLFAGKLIKAESLEKMITLEDGFGQGIFGTKYKYGDKELQGYWHNGGIEAFISHMAYYPEKDLSVVVLTNGLNYDIRKIYEVLLDAYFGKEVPVPEFGKVVDLAPELLEPLQGYYKSETHPLDIAITLVDGQLFAQATGQGGFPLSALDENSFEFVKAGIEIRFDRDSDMFEIKQGGRADVFIKEKSATKKQAMEIPLATLEQYVGTYQADNFPLDIEIVIKNGQLYAQATGQSAFPLTPISHNKFKFTLADIVIEFDVEKRHLIITQRGQPNILQKQ